MTEMSERDIKDRQIEEIKIEKNQSI